MKAMKARSSLSKRLKMRRKSLSRRNSSSISLRRRYGAFLSCQGCPRCECGGATGMKPSRMRAGASHCLHTRSPSAGGTSPAVPAHLGAIAAAPDPPRHGRTARARLQQTHVLRLTDVPGTRRSAAGAAVRPLAVFRRRRGRTWPGGSSTAAARCRGPRQGQARLRRYCRAGP